VTCQLDFSFDANITSSTINRIIILVSPVYQGQSLLIYSRLKL